jgi:glucose 1-dehydrogenase
MLLAGKVAAVTGSAQGIGRACAERLAKEGAKVVLCDIAAAKGQDAAKAIAATGGTASFVICDVSKPGDVAAAVDAAIDAHGRIDILVNNAGVLDDAPFLELRLEEFDRVMAVNLRGAFLMGQAVARQFVKQSKSATPLGDQSKSQANDGRGVAPPVGVIVNMSSVNAVFALPDHVAYSISKGGINQLTKAMAIALAPHGIRVNAVGPGTIHTPLLDGVIKDAAFRGKVLSRTPLGRFGRPEEVAAIVAWLASDEASYVTGTTIYADGGRLPLNYVVPVDEEI